MLHTKYRSFGCCGFREEDFFCMSMGTNDPRGGAIFDPRGMVGWKTTIHCYIQNMKALGLVVSEKKIFLCFSNDTPGAGPVWTTGALLAGFIKRTTIHHICIIGWFPAYKKSIMEIQVTKTTHRRSTTGFIFFFFFFFFFCIFTRLETLTICSCNYFTFKTFSINPQSTLVYGLLYRQGRKRGVLV